MWASFLALNHGHDGSEISPKKKKNLFCIIIIIAYTVYINWYISEVCVYVA